ncbi:MAG: RNA polymerase sigma-54 factor [Planctomycetes bacterium ADurb.Bin412]|nr:MAG: RNA polymerase sigma-54 factor [Planctomycetes bacterium ADurb.Bin412]
MPNGIYPLRYFFCGGTENAQGESVSWDAVKAKLEEVINSENKDQPFNDDELVIEMQKHGLQLARRTIAKYRSLLNIPPARRRKKFQ